LRKGKPIIRRRISAGKPLSFDYTLAQAFDYFIALKKAEAVRERTMRDYHTLMQLFSEWLGGDDVPVNKITTATIRDYVVYLRDEHVNERTGEVGLSPTTINVRLRFLKVFFNTLFREEIIDANPVRNVKLMRADDDPIELLTDEEIERLLSVMDVREYSQFRDKVICYTILDCGIRIGELCAVEVQDIDFKTRTINLPGHKTKNRKPRLLPLSNKTTRLLLELITENKAHFDSSYVFLSNFGERYNPNSFRRRLILYREKAGINKRVSPHVLRHIFCRNYILAGGDVFSLARIAGHADIATTRRYVDMSKDDIKAQHALYSPVLRIRDKYK